MKTSGDLGNNPLYLNCPMDELIKQSPDLMINLSASPFDYTHVEDRKAIIKLNVMKYRLPMFYCNCVGSQTEIIFDGASLVFDKDANMIKQLPMFEEAMESFIINDDNNFELPVLTQANDLPDEELSPLELDYNLCALPQFMMQLC